MAEQHDPIAFFRHVLRAGDVVLARRLGGLLMADPRYRDRVDELLPPEGDTQD